MGPQYPLLPQITTCDVDVCFVLDGSDNTTDMGWRNETTALQAILQAMGLGNPGLVSVVSSATPGANTTLLPPTPLFSVNTSLLANSTRPGGALNVSQAIDTCATYLNATTPNSTTPNSTAPSRGKVIVLLASGNNATDVSILIDNNITLISVPEYNYTTGVSGVWPNVSLLNLSLVVAPAICTAPFGERLLHAHLTLQLATARLVQCPFKLHRNVTRCMQPCSVARTSYTICTRSGRRWHAALFCCILFHCHNVILLHALCVMCVHVTAGECRRVTRPSGLDLHTSPCLASPQVYGGHADFNQTVWLDTNRGHQSSNCSVIPKAASDPFCWIYVYTSTGEAGWLQSGMPAEPQTLPCGQAPGEPYPACCGSGHVCSSATSCE